MNKLKLSALALLALFAVSQAGPAMAMGRFNQGYPKSYGYNQRISYGNPGYGFNRGYGNQPGYGYQQSAMQQIRHGIRDGQLTSSEAKQLMKDQQRLRQTAQRAYADGYLSSGERQKLARMRQQENRDIFKQTHDNQVRW